MSAFWQSVFLQGGYNTTIVMVGALLLGLSAGAAGTFVFLRKRAMLSDAVSHATLPGLCLAFVVMAAFGTDGRFLPGLLLGAALSAALGLWAVEIMLKRTKLSEDVAIGAVLSVFFGAGVMLLSLVQGLNFGGQAGLETFLLGSTAGMVRAEVTSLAVLAGLCFIVLWMLRRELVLVAFDEGFAAAQGMSVGLWLGIALGLGLIVAVVGLKIVGLILIIALLILPSATARFWTDQPDKLFLLAAAFGGVSAYLGAAISASMPNTPTGPVIVLTGFCLFLISLILSPKRGLVARWLSHREFQTRVHLRQGLLALARQEPILEPFTRRLLLKKQLISADGLPTLEGRAEATRVLRDEARWAALRGTEIETSLTASYDGRLFVDEVLTRDELSHLDGLINKPKLAGAH